MGLTVNVSADCWVFPLCKLAVAQRRIFFLSPKYMLNANQQHVHLDKIKCFEDMRPGQQLQAAQRQHKDLCTLIGAKAVTPHTILQVVGVGGTFYTEHTLRLYQFKQLGLGHQRANKLACKLHAHSVVYDNKLVTTG
eukprot:scaffold13867_cov20-Tisochrysis_lutea.AAC.1